MKKILIASVISILFACSRQPANKTIEFWQFWTDPKAKPVIESIVHQFEKENPGWKVNVTDLTWSDGHQKIIVAFGAGNPPDLLELGSDWIAEFAAGNALAKLDLDTSQFALVEPGIFENQIYAQPWLIASRILYVDETLLSKTGLSFPQNWEELGNACEKINSPSESIAGFGANLAEPHRLYKKFLPFVWSCGGDIIKDGKIVIDTPEVLKALEFYGKLTGYSQIETQSHLEDSFVNGQLGFLISGGWLLNRLQENPPDFKYRLMFMLPEETGGQAYSFAGGEYLVIPAGSKKQEMARKLIDIIIQPANVIALCDSVGFGDPPYKEKIREYASSDNELLFKQLLNSRSTPVHPRWIYVESIIETMVEQVTLGKLTPQQAIKEAQANIDETLK